jgi:TolA-binding protein
MARLCRCLLIFLALLPGGARLCAASSGEEHAYSIAEKAFKMELWDYAENRFGAFVEKYPKSARVPEAILLQARARFSQDRFADTVALLTSNESRAGMWEDDYLYWIAQAQVQSAHFQAAADAFDRLVAGFPNSTRRLEASVEEATAIAQVGDWQRVADGLTRTNGVFQQALADDRTNEWVIRGCLLLGEADLELGKLADAQTALGWMSGQISDPELSWRREYLRSRLLLATGHAEEALEASDALPALARAALPPQPDTNAAPSLPDARTRQAEATAARLLAESWSFRASILEKLQRLDQAIVAYQNNLDSNAPVELQRHALFKIAGLYLAQNQYASATTDLESFLSRHGNSKAADMALLTIGELELKQYELARKAAPEAAATSPSVTNLLQQAMERFSTLLAAFPQSPLAGEALLDQGWCLWSDEQYAAAAGAFRRATRELKSSDKQAVARFKWADAQFMQGDYAGATTNYDAVIDGYAFVPGIPPGLIEQALYQVVRATLPTDAPAASRAMRRILESYPNGFAGPHCLMLAGEGLSRQRDPAGARALFAEFESRYPTDPLLPDVRLAVARTYEQEANWEEAADQYAQWVALFTNHIELPRAEFFRALDCYRAGRETNAFTLLAKLVTRFPDNPLTRDAQWWIGDYYWRQGDYQNAEINYQLVWKNAKTNWPPSVLTYEAQMMAGRAAIGRVGYNDAIGYFTNLAANTACPLDLRLEASFAAGDAFMARTDPGSTNRMADLQEALAWFSSIPQSYPTHQLAAPALGRIGDCYLQFAALDPKLAAAFYEKSSAAYRRAAQSPQADIAVRSQAAIGEGLAAEGLAKLKDGPEQKALLLQAFEAYQDVFLQSNVRDGEQAGPFWVKRAGLEAGRVAESLQRWRQAVNLYQQLENWLPQLRPALEKKILNAEKNAALQNP